MSINESPGCFLFREKPWSRPSSAKLLSWRNSSPPQPTRRCLGITVKLPARRARGGFTREYNQTASFCKLLRVMFFHPCRFLCLFLDRPLRIWYKRSWLRFLSSKLFFASQSERQRGIGYFCSLHDIRENCVPLSDPPRQIREMLHARGNKV